MDITAVCRDLSQNLLENTGIVGLPCSGHSHSFHVSSNLSITSHFIIDELQSVILLAPYSKTHSHTQTTTSYLFCVCVKRFSIKDMRELNKFQ